MPTTNNVHIDAPLSNLAIGFVPTRTIVQDIFPIVPVPKQSDLYFIYDKGDFFRVPDTRRAEKTKGTKVDFSVSSDSYRARNYALVREIANETLANADNPLRIRDKSSKMIIDLLALDWEKRVASVISSGSNVGSFTTLSGTGQWSDFANSDPINDVEVGKEAVRSTTGLMPNLAIVPQAVWTKLKQHPDLIDRVKYTKGGFIEPEQLSQFFGIPKILIPQTIENTGSPGLTDTFADVWGKNVVLAHVAAPSPSGEEPSLGYTFRWTSPLLGSRPMAVERWPDPDNGGFENIRVQLYQDEKITASELGYVIASAVA